MSTAEDELHSYVKSLVECDPTGRLTQIFTVANIATMCSQMIACSLALPFDRYMAPNSIPALLTTIFARVGAILVLMQGGDAHIEEMRVAAKELHELVLIWQDKIHPSAPELWPSIEQINNDVQTAVADWKKQ